MESPCIMICSIELNTGWCHGCGRTRDEIGAWTLYSDEQRTKLMKELPDRVAQLEKRPRRVTRRKALEKKRNRESG